MALDNLPARVAVDGLVLNDIDGNGATWVLEDIDGWNNGPGVEVDQVQRVVAHGQFGQAGHRTGRLVVLSGAVAAVSRQGALASSKTLATVLADGGFNDLTITDDDAGTLTARVQLASRPEIEWLGELGFRFQLQLLAPDPYRYGTTVSASTGFATEPEGVGFVWDAFPGGVADWGDTSSASSGVARVTNLGTAPAAPLFTVAGPTPGFRVSEVGTGNKITFASTVPSGSSVVIDSRSGSAVIDGTADRSGDAIVSGSWPSIPPGGAREYLFQPTGSTSAATLTVDVVSTYW